MYLQSEGFPDIEKPVSSLSDLPASKIAGHTGRLPQGSTLQSLRLRTTTQLHTTVSAVSLRAYCRTGKNDLKDKMLNKGTVKEKRFSFGGTTIPVVLQCLTNSTVSSASKPDYFDLRIFAVFCNAFFMCF